MTGYRSHPAGAGQRADLVAQLQHHALSAALADPGHAGQRGDVPVGQCLAQRAGVVDGQGGQTDLGPHAGHPEQHLEQITGAAVGESVEGLRVLAHDHRGDQPGLGPAAQGRQRRRRGHDLVAHAGGFDDGVVQGDLEDLPADRGDHACTALSRAL